MNVRIEDFFEIGEQRVDEKKETTSPDMVKKWIMWCFNYDHPFEGIICKVWGGTLSFANDSYCCEDNYSAQYLIEKWWSFDFAEKAERMMYFYCSLDSEKQNQLLDWVMKNYVC